MNNINYNIFCFNIIVWKGLGFDLKKLKRIIFFTIGVTFVILFLSSCKKIVEIPEPIDTITTSETFNSDANAISAVMGIYNHMTTQSGPGFANGTTTLFAGLSSDELNYFINNTGILQFQQNNLLPDNANLKSDIWDPAYFNIYQANSVIEGLENSTGVSVTVKNQLLGEAKFLRAFCYFYLTNFFGDVPLITNTSWLKASVAPRTSTDMVYDQIVLDLKDAQNLLANDYSFSNGERIRVNKWAADALLARVYLYREDWINAEVNSSNVINNSNLYTLLSDLNTVFLKNSKESIWQLQITNGTYSTGEGFSILPPSATANPRYFITDSVYKAFDSSDKRKTNWLSSTTYSGVKYYYPFKYKVRIGSSTNITEYYTMLRLSEQFLIRAEAREKQNKLVEAISDLNAIRIRAGISNLPDTLSQQQVFDAIVQERRIELFSEWGHRWFDLKRWGKANLILSGMKGGNWQATDVLYPIPVTELQTDPNLIQNAGY